VTAAGTVRTARRVSVTGRVQGVFYRDTARREAERRGVAGWVRNRPDGSVEALFEGSPEAVDQMVDWARRGPRGADVDAVEVSDEPAQGRHDFAIR
jgi:acylphosphatase